MTNTIPPFITTPHFIVRPLVPVSLAWSKDNNIHQHIAVGSTENFVKYPKTSRSSNNADTSIDNIDEWLKELSQKSKEPHTSSSYKRQHKRHR